MVEAAGVERRSRRNNGAGGKGHIEGVDNNLGENQVSGGVVWRRFETGWGHVELAEIWRRSGGRTLGRQCDSESQLSDTYRL